MTVDAVVVVVTVVAVVTGVTVVAFVPGVTVVDVVAVVYLWHLYLLKEGIQYSKL